MCGGAVGKGLSSIDPTTKGGLLNLATGGLYGTYNKASEELAEVDDQLRGEDQQEAAEEAAKKQEEAARAAVNLQERIYEEGVGRLDPFYQQGLGTLEDYFNLISPEGAAEFKANYLQSDEYQNQLNTGLSALEQSAAFSGTLGAGGTLAKVGDYVTRQAGDLSTQALNQELARLGSGVDIGTSAAGALTSAGQQFAGQASNSLNQIGQAQAAREIAGAGQGLMPYLQILGAGTQIYGSVV